MVREFQPERVVNGRVFYRVACCGCDEHAEIEVPQSLRGTIDCPQKCGAVYEQYVPRVNEYRLKCTVWPKKKQ